MTRQQAIDFGTDRLELFGGQMEEFIKISLEALKEQQTAKHHDEEIIKQLCYMVDDININEIYAHNTEETLFSWLRSWRGEMRRLINQLDMREVES